MRVASTPARPHRNGSDPRSLIRCATFRVTPRVSCGRVSPVKLESSAGVTWPHASQCRGGVRLARTTTLALGCQGKVSQKTTVGAGWRGAAWGGQSAQTPRRQGSGPLTGPGEQVGPDGWPAQIWTGASRGLGGAARSESVWTAMHPPREKRPA
jgi:hypothetical protein